MGGGQRQFSVKVSAARKGALMRPELPLIDPGPAGRLALGVTGGDLVVVRRTIKRDIKPPVLARFQEGDIEVRNSR